MGSVTSDSDMPSSVGLNPVTLYGMDSPNAVSPASSGDVDGRFALKHVLDHVLCLPPNNGLRQALQAAGYTKIQQVLVLHESNIKALSYKAKVAGATVTLNILLSEQEMITTLQGFSRFKHNALGRPVTPYDWTMVTEGEYDEYQGSYHLQVLCPP